MGSVQFEILEKQFRSLLDDLPPRVESLGASATDPAQWSGAQDGLDKAEALIRGMDLEARTGDPVLRPQLLGRLREHKIRLLALKKEYRRRAAAGGVGTGSGASSVGAGSGEEGESASEAGTSSDIEAGQRDRLLISTGRLGATSGRLGATRQLALQAEELGVTILKDLHDQRQSIIRATDVIHNVDDEISKSRHIIRQMVAKMTRNKWAVGFIVFALFAAIAVIMFEKLRR